ncbi:protein Niban 2a [Anguilla anguilla]|uniref:protein Niban 2a n=1 Tax=Anguilla anguilla TaxID=7936 RepID=UPI0015A9B32D|nr:protein Niban 2a [Anguilla anguilla]
MGDVISSHLDEGKRQMIAGRTREVTEELSRLYEQQYAVALFNKVRFEIEGNGGPQSQLLHRKDPLQDKNIFSGNLFQCLENRKWRNRYFFIPDSYNIYYYENKMAHDRGLHPKGIIKCAGYRALTSVEEYMELISNSLPGVKAKASASPFLKCATQYCIILWHPYACHHYFCVMTEKEQTKWQAVFQDCIRHTNNELSEEDKVQTPAFTDAVRLYRQARGQYGTWDMMCGEPPQILANLVMESLHPELRDQIGPRLKGKLQQRQRSWMLISDAVYSLVLGQTRAQYEATVQICESRRPPLEAALRTDMDQIITSREHVAGKIRSVVQPKVEQVLKVSVRPYISSILEALMAPTSGGFSEVRDVFSLELVEMNKNILNEGNKDRLGEHMEKISMLAFHPVKMQSCYQEVEKMQLEGLQERFDVSSPSVFIQRAQILMRGQMDNAVYTFEQLLHQNLESAGEEHMCKAIQRCQDRVVKKFDYDSSTVRKKFFREALLQILIPYLLKQLSPSCAGDLPRFQELIFEDFSRFILVENVFEEVVLQSVMKDITMAVKEAAVMRRHNLFRDSMVLKGSDLNLHQLAEEPAVDWAGQYGGEEAGGGTAKRRRQVVSMVLLDEQPGLLHESCLDIPGVERIPEEGEREREGEEHSPSPSVDTPTSPRSAIEIRNADTPGAPRSVMEILNAAAPTSPRGAIEIPNVDAPPSPGGLSQIRDLINPKVEVTVPASQVDSTPLTNGMLPAAASPSEAGSTCHPDDSGFQSLTNEAADEEEAQPITEALKQAGCTVADPERVVVTLEQGDAETGESSGKVTELEPDIVFTI